MKSFYGKHFLFMKVSEKKVIKTLSEICTHNETIVSRIKSPESMSRKLKNDGLEANAVNALTNESDAIGIRIITEKISGVYKIFEKIKRVSKKKKNSFTIINVKDFIKNPKESGYMSFHVIIAVKSNDPEIPEYKAEIQIRTAIMDCWASLEHIVKYKQVSKLTPEIMDILETYRKEAEREVANARGC